MLRLFEKLQEKKPPLHTMPDDTMRHTLSFLDGKDQANFLKSSSAVYRSCQEDYILMILLDAVAKGNQVKAEELIQKKPTLLLRKGDATDYSGRKFTNITPLQYAFWALDTEMWCMIAKYLPNEMILQQFVELEKNGTAHGKHYDFKPLISAMQHYTCQFDSWDENQCSIYWCATVGGLQKLAPAHVANYYCHRASIPDQKYHALSGADRTVYFMSSRLPKKKMHYYKAGLGEDVGILRAFRNPMLARGKIKLTLDCVRENTADLIQIAKSSQDQLIEFITTLKIEQPTPS